MEQKSLAALLKGIVVGMGIFGILFYFLMMPYLGQEVIASNPDKSGWFYPWLIFLWITGIPCYIVLGFGWKIAVSIGKDASFTERNAHRLKMISYLAILDSVFYLVINIVYWLLDMNHPGVVIVSLGVFSAGMVVAVIAAALSHLVKKAAELQEESNLTI